MLSSPSPCEWPSKRRRLTSSTNEKSRFSSKRRDHGVRSNPNSSHSLAYPSSTEFTTPPESPELPCSSPSSSHSSWVAATSSPLSKNQGLGGSTSLSGGSLSLVPAIMSSPMSVFQGDSTPSPSTTRTTFSSGASLEERTPAKDSCPPTCCCQIDLLLDTFGNRPDAELAQLSQKKSPVQGGTIAPRMLFPRSIWCLFKTSTSLESIQPRASLLVYHTGDNGGNPVMVENEDLWMDEENPFLLTPFDLRQVGHEQLISTTSASNSL